MFMFACRRKRKNNQLLCSAEDSDLSGSGKNDKFFNADGIIKIENLDIDTLESMLGQCTDNQS